MNYWLITDTHFNHNQLEQLGGRSGSWQKELWAGLSYIPEDDTLIHLGDICIGKDEEIHAALRDLQCNKILVRGNHDKKSLNWYMERGWNFACDGIDMRYNGHCRHLTHRPARPQGNTTMNIHGHTHGNMHRAEEYIEFYSEEYHVDICPEIRGYKPLRLDTLLKKVGKK